MIHVQPHRLDDPQQPGDERGHPRRWPRYLDGHELTEGLLNHIEVAIRAFDPCLSCATHALGQMPLVVELVDADGRPLDRLHRRRRRRIRAGHRCRERDARGGARHGATPAAATTRSAGLPRAPRSAGRIAPAATSVRHRLPAPAGARADLAAGRLVLFVDASRDAAASRSRCARSPRRDATFTTHGDERGRGARRLVAAFGEPAPGLPARHPRRALRAGRPDVAACMRSTGRRDPAVRAARGSADCGSVAAPHDQRGGLACHVTDSALSARRSRSRPGQNRTA